MVAGQAILALEGGGRDEGEACEGGLRWAGKMLDEQKALADGRHWEGRDRDEGEAREGGLRWARGAAGSVAGPLRSCAGAAHLERICPEGEGTRHLGCRAAFLQRECGPWRALEHVPVVLGVAQPQPALVLLGLREACVPQHLLHHDAPCRSLLG